MMTSWFSKINLSALVLALIVIVLGAFVRLSDAGLGCPDWPGCYGQFTAPDNMEEITRAELQFPHLEIDSDKAWKEMLHRYLASLLGLLIIAMAVLAWRHKNKPQQQLVLPSLLVGLVIFQGMLGMWTVTHLLTPTIVTLHLLMGLLTLSLLFWSYLHARQDVLLLQPVNKNIRTGSRIALMVLTVQIFLGGWTSTNYAALYCPDFPTCGGHWVPDMDFKAGFDFTHESGVNYEGGVLSTPAGVAVHVMHRLGALITMLVVGLLALLLLRREYSPLLRKTAVILLTILFIQIALGIANVLLYLPLPLAVAHNAGAAILLMVVIFLNYLVKNADIKGERRE
jgi:heme a synthase